MKTKTFKNQVPANTVEEILAILDKRYLSIKDMASRGILLSEDFIKENIDNIDGIFKYQTLSEDFIKENAEGSDWDLISSYQNLSEDFIKENKDKINFYFLQKNQYVSETLKAKFLSLVPKKIKLDTYQKTLDMELNFAEAKDEIEEMFETNTEEVMKFKQELEKWTKIANISNPVMREYFIKVMDFGYGTFWNYKTIKEMIEKWIMDYKLAKENAEWDLAHN